MSDQQKKLAMCPGCCRRVRIKIPWGGDGSADVYCRHKLPSGDRCDYSQLEVKPQPEPETKTP